MKTLIIFNSVEKDIEYFIINGDYSRFNNVVFNGFNDDPLIKECSEWLWDYDGKFLHNTSTNTSLIEDKQWDKVSIITWIP
jgi:hypothetical protein